MQIFFADAEDFSQHRQTRRERVLVQLDQGVLWKGLDESRWVLHIKEIDASASFFVSAPRHEFQAEPFEGA
ncbi:hypothetical protein AO240_14335 [Pseudomonas sp. ICMP 460]|nr:hypothetical protein AO240_14335 [Pseudomonas sp. ICMP 460]